MFFESLFFVLSLSFVFGGGDSEASLSRWNVKLFLKVDQDHSVNICGGTVLGRSYVITSGSCVESLDVGKVFVRGVEDKRDIFVDKVLKHPKDDIALLKTIDQFNVEPLTFWRASRAEELIVGKRAIVDNAEEFFIISRKKCRDSDARFYTKYLVEKKSFCAEQLNGTIEQVLNGEGLFIADKNGTWNLRGIVGGVQSISNDFVLFRDVTPYLPWIADQTGDTGIAAASTSPECGQRSAIDEGRPWPWQGQIYRNDSGSIQRLCTAAIISERFLVSPAGVFSASELKNPTQLALTFSSHDGEKSQVFHSQRIGKIIRHEQFYPESGSNNIALLQLQTPLRFSERLAPICLWRGDPRELNVNLKKAGTTGLFTPVDKAACDGPQNSFCIETGAPIAWNDTFYTENDGSWYLKGITVNISTGENGSKAVLLDVPRYREWIDENTVFRKKNLLGNLECAKRFINDYTFISDEGGKRCFAAHIKPSILLTTATCLENVSASEINGTSGTESSRAATIHIHPRFDASNRANNIAIVQLEQPLTGAAPFCIHLDGPRRRKFRLRSLLPTRGFERYFYDLALAPGGMLECADQWRRQERVELDTGGGHFCGELEGVGEGLGEGFCTGRFEGSSSYYDYGDGQGVYLRGLMDLDKRNHCEKLLLPEVYVDVTFYAEWIRDIVGAFREDS